MENHTLNNEKVLITDDVHPDLIDGLRKYGVLVTYNPSITLEEVHQVIHIYKGIVINSKIICDQSLLEKAHKLKFIARLGSGLDIIDIPLAKARNISVLNSPEGNRNAVAEHAMAMILSLSNKIVAGAQEILNAPWDREKHRGFEWEGKYIGVYGFGHTGRAFAEKWAGFSVNVLAYDKYKEHYAVDYRFIKEVNREYIIQNADVLSFHLPLTKETQDMVNADFLSHCKKGVIIVNTSRGGILNTLDLLQSLESGHVGGACLDVLENEKSDTWTREERQMYQSLATRSNVICTPHVAGWTVQSKKKIAHILLGKICTTRLFDDYSD